MRIAFRGTKGVWLKATSEYEKIIAHAMTATVREAGKQARDAARENIAAAGFGSHWQNSMKFSMHPKSGDVMNPWGWVHSTINFADVFETGKTISAANSAFLWIPLPGVPKWPGDSSRQMSPKKYVDEVGPLITLRRKGKLPMLGAVLSGYRGGIPKRSQLPKQGKFSQRQEKRQMVVVPMFIAVDEVTIEKRFDTKAAMARVIDQMPQLYAENELPNKA